MLKNLKKECLQLFNHYLVNNSGAVNTDMLIPFILHPLTKNRFEFLAMSKNIKIDQVKERIQYWCNRNESNIICTINTQVHDDFYSRNNLFFSRSGFDNNIPELDKWIKTNLEDADTNPSVFWSSDIRAEQYPTLKKVAQSFFAFVPSTARVERFFSTCGHILDSKSNRMDQFTLSKRIFLTSYFRINEFESIPEFNYEEDSSPRVLDSIRE